MKISQRDWQGYISDLRKTSEKASDMISWYLQTHDVSTKAGRKALLDFAYAVTNKYGEGAAEKACQLHDAVAEMSGKAIPPAVPAKMPSYPEVAKTVNGMLLYTDNLDYVGSSVGRLVKRTGVDTTMQNAIRDGAEWAWVPSGDSCAFCLVLASQGWQRASKEAMAGGHAEHIHSNCDCTYAIRFDKNTQVEGYNPDDLRKQYEAAEGTSSKDKINYMRRQQYAVNKDKINAQKRAAYAKRNNYAFKVREAQRARQITTMDELKKVSSSGIINMKNETEISSYFSEAFGIKVEGFEGREFEKIKITLAGYDDLMRICPDAAKHIRIIRFDPALKDYGSMNAMGLSRVGNKGLGSYGTGLHEAAHALDYYKSDFETHSYADGIITKALRKVGLRKNSRDYISQAFMITGDVDDAKKAYELFAYAIETELGQGKANKLSKAIYEEMIASL